MIIKKIRARNYLSIEKIDIDIGSGVFFIEGNNLDDASSSSNGAGKSVFCSTIAWCLFDDFVRQGMKKDDVIGPFDEYARVQVTIELKPGDELVVDRGRNHPDKGNYCIIKRNGKNLTQHTSKMNAVMIERILGISKQVFFRSVYFQEDNKSILNATPAELMRVIGEIIGLEYIDELSSEARTHLKRASISLESLKSQGTQASQRLERIKERIAKTEEKLVTFDETKRRERLLLVEKIREQEETLKGINSKIERFLGHYGSLENCKSARKKWIDANSILTTRRSNARNLEDRVRSLRNTIQANSSTLEKIRCDHDNLLHNTTGTCNHCGQVMVSSEFTILRGKELSQELIKYETRANELMFELTGLEDRLAVARSDVEYAEKVLTELPSQEEVAQRDEHAVLFEAWESQKHILTSNIRNMSESLASFDETKRTSYETFSEMLEELRQEEVAALEELSEKRASYKLEHAKKQALAKTVGIIKDFKMASINSFIVNLVDHINENLEIITNGDMVCDINVSEKTDSIELRFTSSAKKDFYPYSVFSTGEKTRIRKSVETALNSILGINFMVDDEGMKGVDDNGVSSIMEFMSSNSGLGTVFVVSHHPNAFNEKMGKIIRVTKENQATRAEVI